MGAKEIIYNFQMQRFEVFKTQDVENGKFDVTFQIDGKPLYAHKAILCLISPTFDSMLSDRWRKPDELVKIDEYSYDAFKELLNFIYSGDCELNGATIDDIIDMAEFYRIQALKDVCEEYLSEYLLCSETIHEMVELANKYSLAEFKKTIHQHIKSDFAFFFKSNEFQTLQKSTVKELVETYQESPRQGEIFEAVYKWAETQALEKQKMGIGLDLNEIIKEELTEFLPLIKFEKMNHIFLIKFVVVLIQNSFLAKKSFLFPGDVLSDILFAAERFWVKIVDKNGKTMKGEVQCDEMETVANDIQSVKSMPSKSKLGDGYIYWETFQQFLPSKPSKLIKNDTIQWYLGYDDDGNLAVIYHDEDFGLCGYLLAEMVAEDGFDISGPCKIKFLRSP
uniref:BTB domain-containing protein n=1 Tax=Panagrolaimus davidi TaxID=227884 RepID=A0A914QHI8_9BILA